jgi:hypothetical protein
VSWGYCLNISLNDLLDHRCFKLCCWPWWGAFVDDIGLDEPGGTSQTVVGFVLVGAFDIGRDKKMARSWSLFKKGGAEIGMEGLQDEKAVKLSSVVAGGL